MKVLVGGCERQNRTNRMPLKNFSQKHRANKYKTARRRRALPSARLSRFGRRFSTKSATMFCLPSTSPFSRAQTLACRRARLPFGQWFSFDCGPAGSNEICGRSGGQWLGNNAIGPYSDEQADLVSRPTDTADCTDRPRALLFAGQWMPRAARLQTTAGLLFAK